MKLKSQKPHIGIFGRRNSGKSSIINAMTGQETAIVSPEAGTTTDPVTKTMEIIGIGPVVFTDTAGTDDVGDLGKKRVSRAFAAMDAIDLGIIVATGNEFGPHEHMIAGELKRRDIPFFVLHNKSDLVPLNAELRERIERENGARVMEFCAPAPSNFDEIASLVCELMPKSAYQNPSILGDLVAEGDTVILVTPVDIETPHGRMILPQVQAIRDLLDHECVAVVLKQEALASFLASSAIRPRLVVTDSQAFKAVDEAIPGDIPLTSFSILYARMKGDFEKFIDGTPAISKLRDGDRVMILESCTHHVAGDDIGRVKLPRWISNFTGRQIRFDVVAGRDPLPEPVSNYSLVVQCGGCMLTNKQVLMRLAPAVESGIPVTNYGMAIAWCLGLFERAMEPFKAL